MKKITHFTCAIFHAKHVIEHIVKRVMIVIIS